MRLATQRDGTRDGSLVVVSSDGERFVRAESVAESLQGALDDWRTAEPRLRRLHDALESDPASGEPLDLATLQAPLPRAYQWIDASGYLSHLERVRRARGAALPPSFRSDPVMYQGLSDQSLAWNDPLPSDPSWGTDLEAELAAIVVDVEASPSVAQAIDAVALLVLVNDVSLRSLIPDELAKGFGFFVSKPASAYAPFAVTPDAFGPAWREGRLSGRVLVSRNGVRLGDLRTGGDDQDFGFADIVRHAARTRRLGAGTVVGAGTVSNRDEARGVGCLVEKRTLEQLAGGPATTPYLDAGDVVSIEFRDDAGRAPFGRIEQRVVAATVTAP